MSVNDTWVSGEGWTTGQDKEWLTDYRGWTILSLVKEGETGIVVASTKDTALRNGMLAQVRGQ